MNLKISNPFFLLASFVTGVMPVACTQQQPAADLLASDQEANVDARCFTQKEIPFASGAIDPTTYTLPAAGPDRVASDTLADMYFWYLTCNARIGTAKECKENDRDADLYASDAYIYAKNFNITNGELVALRDYTYSGAGSLNNPLWRDRSSSGLAAVESRIKTLTSALNKLPVYAEDGPLYRGTNFLPEQMECLQQNVGKTFYHPAFLSASTSEKVARGFNSSTLLRIHQSTSGHPVDRFALAPAEEEVLFVPGLEFRIDAIQTLKNAQGKDEFVIDLTQVAQ